MRLVASASLKMTHNCCGRIIKLGIARYQIRLRGPDGKLALASRDIGSEILRPVPRLHYVTAPDPDQGDGLLDPQAAGRHILVVDYGSDSALIRQILEPAGYSVSDIRSGRLAAWAVQQEVFDLVILDLTMPEMDGFEILQAIRNQNPKPRILVVSRFMQDKLLAAAKALGAAAVLDKHLIPDMLVVA